MFWTLSLWFYSYVWLSVWEHSDVTWIVTNFAQCNYGIVFIGDGSTLTSVCSFPTISIETFTAAEGNKTDCGKVTFFGCLIFLFCINLLGWLTLSHSDITALGVQLSWNNTGCLGRRKGLTSLHANLIKYILLIHGVSVHAARICSDWFQGMQMSLSRLTQKET